MRLCTFVEWTRVVKSLALLTVLLEAKFVPECEVEARRHLEERPTNVLLTLPKTAHYSIDVVDLKDLIELELSDVLKYSFVSNTLLKQLYLNLFWFIVVLIDAKEVVFYLITHRINPQ